MADSVHQTIANTKIGRAFVFVRDCGTAYTEGMAVRHWNRTADGPMTEAALRRKLEALGYTVAKHVYAPGTEFPDHTHEADKIDAVVSGRFRLVVAGHLAVLGPGDRIEIPRGVRHNARVIGDEPVVSLDAIRIHGRADWFSATNGESRIANRERRTAKPRRAQSE